MSTITDDLDQYLGSLSGEEREEVDAAAQAFDLAVAMYNARVRKGLSQSAAAELSGFAQQAVSRFERPHMNIQLATLQRHLGALGYDLEIGIRDSVTGEYAGKVSYPSAIASERRRSRNATA